MNALRFEGNEGDQVKLSRATQSRPLESAPLVVLESIKG